MKGHTTNDPGVLARWLTQSCKGIVVFDGAPSAGKTKLMKDVAGHLHQCACIDVDVFLIASQGTFIDAIRFDQLRNTLYEAIDKNHFVLMASVCARIVIERLGVPNATFVYVRRDDGARSSESLAEEDDEIESEEEFQREVEKYHQDYKPFRNAHVRYIRKTTSEF